MHNNHVKLEQVSKDYAIHVIGEDEHNYIVQAVLVLKKASFREFVDSMGNKMFLRFVPMADEVRYFIDDGEV